MSRWCTLCGMDEVTRRARRELQNRLKERLRDQYVLLEDAKLDELADRGRNRTHRQVAFAIRSERRNESYDTMLAEKPEPKVKRGI